ncbi:MAG: hypothetical protein OHK0022_17020 [Roseiflexaceae bacterium]
MLMNTPPQHISALKQRLHTLRQTVGYLLEQAAASGGEVQLPPDRRHSLAQSRADIAECKRDLRALGVQVDDWPGDEAASSPHTGTAEHWPELEAAYRAWLRRRYGAIQILGMAEPVALDEIFTDLHLLDRTTAWRQFNLEQLQQRASLGDDVGAEAARRTGLEVVRQHPRIYLLGRPGAGKSTFLRYLALQAASGLLDALPIMVELKVWARSQTTLDAFLLAQLAEGGFSGAELFLAQTLSSGHALLLFDGLDEVPQEQGTRAAAIQGIRALAGRYPHCRIVITCRSAADEHVFEHFSYSELAGFSPAQMRAFAAKWFARDPFKRDRFLQQLEAPEQAGLRDLARTPLLLTLLCLTFDATMGFPARRVDIYEAALDVLLRRWDASRSVERDSIYRELSPARKRQLLARIAFDSFERGELFLRRAELEQRIADFVGRLPGPASLRADDAAAMLAVIEAQHGLLVERAPGVYAFSHLTFHEYFAAHAVADNLTDERLARLLARAHDPRWREVLRAVASLLDEEAAARFFAQFGTALRALLANDKAARTQVRWSASLSRFTEEMLAAKKISRKFVARPLSVDPFGIDTGGGVLSWLLTRNASASPPRPEATQSMFEERAWRLGVALIFDESALYEQGFSALSSYLEPDEIKQTLDKTSRIARQLSELREELDQFANDMLRRTDLLDRPILSGKASIAGIGISSAQSANQTLIESLKELLTPATANLGQGAAAYADASAAAHRIKQYLREAYEQTSNMIRDSVANRHSTLNFWEKRRVQALHNSASNLHTEGVFLAKELDALAERAAKVASDPLLGQLALLAHLRPPPDDDGRDLGWLALLWRIVRHAPPGTGPQPLGASWRAAVAALPEEPPELAGLRAALLELGTPEATAPGEEWQEWLLRLRALLTAQRRTGLRWPTDERPGAALGQYLDAAALLCECLDLATVADREAILEGILTI